MLRLLAKPPVQQQCRWGLPRNSDDGKHILSKVQTVGASSVSNRRVVSGYATMRTTRGGRARSGSLATFSDSVPLPTAHAPAYAPNGRHCWARHRFGGWRRTRDLPEIFPQAACGAAKQGRMARAC